MFTTPSSHTSKEAHIKHQATAAKISLRHSMGADLSGHHDFSFGSALFQVGQGFDGLIKWEDFIDHGADGFCF